jgi:hypothetical protein
MQRTFSLTISISIVVTGLEKPLAKTNRHTTAENFGTTC